MGPPHCRPVFNKDNVLLVRPDIAQNTSARCLAGPKRQGTPWVAYLVRSLPGLEQGISSLWIARAVLMERGGFTRTRGRGLERVGQ